MKFLKKIFSGMKNSSAENETKCSQVETSECEERIFNSKRNDLLSDIAQSLADGRCIALRAYVENYKKEYGRLSTDASFYRYDKIVGEWYESSPLLRWCRNDEVKELFEILCEE